MPATVSSWLTGSVRGSRPSTCRGIRVHAPRPDRWARRSIERMLGGGVPRVVWCAGAEAWLALPPALRAAAVVDVIDLPSRNRGELARVAMHDVEVTGLLADVGKVFDVSSVMIAPIRAGSGTTVEVVDAWARAIPVVATSRGVEGLDARDGDDVLVADDPAEFAARCSMVARLPDLRARLVRHGRARYEAEFTWERIGRHLRALLTQPA